MNLQVEGITAHVQRLGTGEQVLMLHGWGPGSVNLEKHLLPVAARLQQHYELTLVDFPGHGQSGPPGSSWAVKDYAQWTLQLMDQMGLHQPVILAHSFGGRIALWLAANYPQRVKALVLTGCAGLRDKKTVQGFLRGKIFRLGRTGLSLLALIPPLKEKSQHMLAALRRQFASGDYMATPEALRGSFSRIVSEDLGSLLPRVKQRTLLVWGEKDTATPLAHGRRMARELIDARLLVYAADDHFAYLNQAARFANAVDIFLGEDLP